LNKKIIAGDSFYVYCLDDIVCVVIFQIFRVVYYL